MYLVCTWVAQLARPVVWQRPLAPVNAPLRGLRLAQQALPAGTACDAVQRACSSPYRARTNMKTRSLTLSDIDTQHSRCT